MTEPCVIRADYSNWRTVAGRKVLQLVFEVPIEQTADVMARLGVPMPGESRWCAIALLSDEKPIESLVAQRSEPPAHNGSVAGSNPAGTTKNRKPFASLPLSQQAALRSNDADFQSFVGCPGDEEGTAKYIRLYCRVESRADIKPRTKTGIMWESLDTQFKDFLTTQRYGDSAR